MSDYSPAMLRQAPLHATVHAPTCRHHKVVYSCECGANVMCFTCKHGAGQHPCNCSPPLRADYHSRPTDRGREVADE